MVSQSAVPVTTDADVWRRALIRARARGYDVEYVKSRVIDGVPFTFWRVSSNSEPGNWRSVSVARLDNDLSLSCDCPAGQNDRPCVHVALVLRESGYLTLDPDPLAVALTPAA